MTYNVFGGTLNLTLLLRFMPVSNSLVRFFGVIFENFGPYRCYVAVAEEPLTASLLPQQE